MMRVHPESSSAGFVAKVRVGAVVLAASLLGACAGAGSAETFYALNDGGVVLATTTPTATTRGGPSLGGIVISSVTVPELVDRPQIVTRDSSNRVTVSEQNLWAEPVRSAVARTLASRLAHALVDAGRPAQVAAYPQSSIVNPYLRITVDVVRFDAVPNGEAIIDALWSIRNTADGSVRAGRTVASEPIAGTSYDAIVHGWNDALLQVDRDIAAMVVQLSTSAPQGQPAPR